VEAFDLAVRLWSAGRDHEGLCEMLHELGDERISTLHRFLRGVDEVRLHIAPPVAEAIGVACREEPLRAAVVPEA